MTSIIKYLANLGYGSRREVTAMVKGRQVTRRDGSVVRDGDAFAHDDLLVDDRPVDPAPGAIVMLHKPTGYVCSAKDSNPLIYGLLPPRFALRSPIMASVGRLDRDTSGLLLVTDDGKLNHRLTSPRVHIPKVYEVVLASDLRGDEAELFASGALMLNGESTALRPATLEVIGPRAARITLTEGRYHQVRRMFAAAGNLVESLHRRSIGGLDLAGLEAGAWRVLNATDVARLFGSDPDSDPPR